MNTYKSIIRQSSNEQLQEQPLNFSTNSTNDITIPAATTLWQGIKYDLSLFFLVKFIQGNGIHLSDYSDLSKTKFKKKLWLISFPFKLEDIL